MKKEHVKLTSEDQFSLETLLKGDTLSRRQYKRINALLELNKGRTLKEVSQLLELSYQTLSSWSKKYASSGLMFLKDQPRSGRPLVIDQKARAEILKLAESEPPEGVKAWSLRKLAEKAIELGICEQISHVQIGKILKEQVDYQKTV